jgi:hypothetical protein
MFRRIGRPVHGDGVRGEAELLTMFTAALAAPTFMARLEVVARTELRHIRSQVRERIFSEPFSSPV